MPVFRPGDSPIGNNFAGYGRTLWRGPHRGASILVVPSRHGGARPAFIVFRPRSSFMEDGTAGPDALTFAVLSMPSAFAWRGSAFERDA
jgi:hypothetical protein